MSLLHCKNIFVAIKKPGTPSTSGSSHSTSALKVKSFASFRKSKGKEWHKKVNKKGKEKVDVIDYIGLMEWNIKQEDLKVKRGKKLPLKISPNANYSTLREEAEKSGNLS